MSSILEIAICESLRKTKELPNTQFGICTNVIDNVYKLFDNSYYCYDTEILLYLQNIWKNWQYYSRELIYPIPTPGFPYAYKGYIYYKEEGELWRNDQGKLRHSLLDFLINVSERDLQC